MKFSQKVGGVFALIGASTNLVGAAVYAIFLLPEGGDSKDDPSEYVVFLANNQAAMRLWLQIIWLAFGGGETMVAGFGSCC